MAESNRTERRLLDSIRKAKTGPDDDTADKASTPAPKTRSSSAKSSPAKSSPSGPAAERPDTGLAGGRSENRRTTIRRAAARPSAPPKKTAQATTSMDRYQSSGRVWPD